MPLQLRDAIVSSGEYDSTRSAFLDPECEPRANLTNKSDQLQCPDFPEGLLTPSGKRPHDIPANPKVTYASTGWTSYGDFLGYAEGQGARGSFRSFEGARTYVRTLGLKSKDAWEAWKRSGARPHDIPGRPDVVYASSGWLSLGDFLGYAGGKVTGAYKRNAAVAGLRALQNDADNDEKGEQDEDDGDEDARGRKQAKRPRGG